MGPLLHCDEKWASLIFMFLMTRIVRVCSEAWLALSVLSGPPLGVSLPGWAAERWGAEQELSAKSFKPAPVVHLCQSLLSFQNSVLSADLLVLPSRLNLGCWGSRGMAKQLVQRCVTHKRERLLPQGL